MVKLVKKQAKRQDTAALEQNLLDAMRREAEEVKISNKADNEIFTIDTTGRMGSRKNAKARANASYRPDIGEFDSILQSGFDMTSKPVSDADAAHLTRKERKAIARAARAGLAAPPKPSQSTLPTQRKRKHREPLITPIPKEDIPKAVLSTYHHTFAAPRPKRSEDEVVDLWDGAEEAREAEKYTRNGMDFLLKTAEGKMKHKRTRSANAHAKNGPLVVAPAGLSINPAPEAHRVLVEIAAKRAAKDEKAHRSFQRKMSGQTPIQEVKVSQSAIAKAKREEEPVVVRPTKVKLKSRQQINKEKKEALKRRLLKKEERRRLAKKRVLNMDRMLNSIEKEEATLERRRRFRKAAREANSLKTKRTGRFEFEAPFPEIPLTEEMSSTGSLREAPKATDLLLDSFNNLRARNKIAVTVFRPLHRRYALKSTHRATRGFVAPDVQSLLRQAEEEAAQNPKVFKETKNSKLRELMCREQEGGSSDGRVGVVGKKGKRYLSGGIVEDGSDDEEDMIPVGDNSDEDAEEAGYYYGGDMEDEDEDGFDMDEDDYEEDGFDYEEDGEEEVEEEEDGELDIDFDGEDDEDLEDEEDDDDEDEEDEDEDEDEQEEEEEEEEEEDEDEVDMIPITKKSRVTSLPPAPTPSAKKGNSMKAAPTKSAAAVPAAKPVPAPAKPVPAKVPAAPPVAAKGRVPAAAPAKVAAKQTGSKVARSSSLW